MLERRDQQPGYACVAPGSNQLTYIVKSYKTDERRQSERERERERVEKHTEDEKNTFMKFCSS